MRARKPLGQALLLVVMICFLFGTPVLASGNVILNADGTFSVENPGQDLFIYADFENNHYTQAVYVDIDYLMEYTINHLTGTRVLMNKASVRPGHAVYEEFIIEAFMLIEDALLYLSRNERVDFYANRTGLGLPDYTRKVVELIEWIESRNVGLQLALKEFSQVFLYEHLSAFHTANDRLESTEFYVEQAVAQDESWVEAQIVLAECYLLKGKPYNAISVLKKNVDLNKNGTIVLKSNDRVSPFLTCIESYSYQGHSFNGHQDKLLRSVSEVDTFVYYRITRNASDWYTVYARALTARGDYAQAEKMAKQAIKNNPQNYAAWQSMGDILLHEQRLNEARKAFQRVNELVTERNKGPWTYENQYHYYQIATVKLATIAFDEENYEEVVDLLIDLNRNLPMIHRVRRIYVEPIREQTLEKLRTKYSESFSAEDYKTALYYMQLFDRLDPDNPYAIFQLWAVNHLLDNEEEAMKYLEILMIDHGDSEPAQELLRFIYGERHLLEER
ncbi:MAG: tetratricopeptide repeat protein [Firmicutes bacterium]|nr:tetratricopeptide repeat protein [Bacillota bacterium]